MGKESSPSNNPEETGPSAVHRIVGARLPDDDRRRILADQVERFHDQERQEWGQHELPKTEEQLQLIELANQATNELLGKCGRQPFDIPPGNHHLLDEQGARKLNFRWESTGAYSMKDQAIFMRPVDDPVVFSLADFHETLHFKSHQAVQRLYPGKNIVPYRRGLEVVTRHGHRSYFRHLDEAVIQELSNRYVQNQLAEHPLTKEAVAASEGRRNLMLRHRNRLSREDAEFLEQLVPYVAELTEKARAVFDQIDPAAGQVERAFEDCKYRKILVSPYARDVRALHSLVDEIYRKNSEQFDSKEQVFDLFVAAVIAGNVLPLGRVIEKTLGKGSFRRLGEGEELVTDNPNGSSENSLG